MIDQNPRALEATTLSKGQKYLDSEILKGRFTPFLGAGASSLRPAKTDVGVEPWSSIWSAVLAVRDGLEQPTQLRYLQSFAQQRLRIGEKAMRELIATPDQMLRKEEMSKEEMVVSKDDPLLDFQRALVRLAAQMGKVFGEAFAGSFEAVGQIKDLAVRINLDPLEGPAKDLILGLLLAVDLALKLPEEAFPPHAIVRGEAKPPRLQHASIYERMLTLAGSLVNLKLWNSSELLGWQERHSAKIQALGENLEPPKSNEVTITIEMLEWLPELLWYTLRFWTPLLPTTAEMAFELALRADLAPPRKADLAQAAEALGMSSADLAGEIKPWFTYCHARREPLTGFHVAIAAVLQRNYDLYARHQAKRQTEKRPAAKPMASYPPSIAFTTNFDQCIEDVFRKKEITHHVIFPVRPRGNHAAKIQWKISTRTGRRDDGEQEQPEYAENEEFEARGPIVVKLHGSPLDRAGKDADHWLVLSELGYLEAVAEKTLPQWLERQLSAQAVTGTQEPNRSLWFLGYSITDWNVRLRLYEHLRYSHGINPPKKAIDRTLDSFRMAILGSLGVGVYLGDLHFLPVMILRALKRVPSNERSDELERLMSWLEDTYK
jgi:hypothetical protein